MTVFFWDDTDFVIPAQAGISLIETPIPVSLE
jgi:hypothetical protein